MKRFLCYLKLSFFTIPLLAAQQDKPIRVVFFGDSITQVGVRPGGYILKMGEMYEKQGLKDKYELIGAGIGGKSTICTCAWKTMYWPKSLT